jgi:hypothetical protein
MIPTLAVGNSAALWACAGCSGEDEERAAAVQGLGAGAVRNSFLYAATQQLYLIRLNVNRAKKNEELLKE